MSVLDPKSVVAKIPQNLLIDGVWRPSTSGKVFEVLNPAEGTPLAEVSSAAPEDGIAALDAAHRAQASWAETTPRFRSNLLRDAFDLILERTELLATLMTLEMGKPLDQARNEVVYGAEFLRWFSEEAPRIAGRNYQVPEGTLQALTAKRPVGPSLMITPWNFPLAMATRKIAPALAAGCTTILKPSVETPLTALAFGDILCEVGVPAGVINVIPTASTAPVTGPIIADRRLRKLSFTGSTRVGAALLREAASNILRTSMELGGLAPFIVFEDADLDLAVSAAVITKMRNMGEACNAASCFYIHQSLAAEFSERLVQEFKKLRIGPGLESGIDVGPMISQTHVNKIAEMVDESARQGAQILTGGKRLDRAGYFYPPTVLTDLKPDNILLQQEVFGPVAPVISFDSEAEVLALANASDFGLAGYVYTRDISRALRLGEQLEVGMIGVNSGTISNPAAPFGGVKHSGLGSEGGVEGIAEYLDTVYIGIPR